MSKKVIFADLLNFRHTPVKLFYFINNVWSGIIVPHSLFKFRRKSYIKFDEENTDYVYQRVNYYMKKNTTFHVSKNAFQLQNLKRRDHSSAYFFDLISSTKYFHPSLNIDFIFGDVIHIPNYPAIVKSRPISDTNENSILLKLNKIRHYNFINDWKKFEDKKNIVITRGDVFKHHKNRIDFLEKFFHHPKFDIGKVNPANPKDKNITDDTYLKEKVTIEDQLNCKFIFCWEGNDVATSLKWVMSSNSIAVMPTPTMETWFMEGTLIPDYHYIHVKDDLSDLEEKIEYYSNNTEEALKIIANANQYVKQFLDTEREKKIELLVMEKYFSLSSQ
ncbi:glycosyl transferase family 90 [Flammeovirga sp. SubArs3]|uniref:glycosyl transferase family 90 n=1 Tax=Flammeovirga sp. SubArs3 TaxID=2995316 RepID=UPI00248A9F73|nr:glycosyl transferase family 90 [Flammeovirga sp. SubArs3]